MAEDTNLTLICSVPMFCATSKKRKQKRLANVHRSTLAAFALEVSGPLEQSEDRDRRL